MENREQLNVFELASFGLSLLAYSISRTKRGQTSSLFGTVTKTVITLIVIGAGIYYIKSRLDVLNDNKEDKSELLEFKESLLEQSVGIRNTSMTNFDRVGFK